MLATAHDFSTAGYIFTTERLHWISLVNVEKQKTKNMVHKCDHALKVLLPEQKVKRDHNQTIKTLLLIEDFFSSAGKIGIPVKWIAFWPYVSGENWEVMNHQ